MASLLERARDQGRAEAAAELIDAMYQSRAPGRNAYPEFARGATLALDEMLAAHVALAYRIGGLRLPGAWTAAGAGNRQP